jgi:asparagine synthase (glutamine-hydrolysing)
MAPRYLILDGGSTDHRRLLASELAGRSGLAIRHTSGSRVVLANAAVPILDLGHGRGVIIGTLFRRTGPPSALRELNEAEIDQIIATEGACLIRRYWGAFVATLRTGKGHVVLRDPSGALPCYIWDLPGYRCFASDPAVLRAGLMRPEIDWRFIARHFHAGGLPSLATGLVGLRELGRGTAAIQSMRCETVRTLWSPWDHGEDGRDHSLSANAGRLREAIDDSTDALSAGFASIVLGISGGLDSSIVGAALTAAQRRFVGITLTTDDPDGDERHYARIASACFGTELVARRHDLSDIDLGRSSVAHLPRPIGRIQALAYDAALLRLAARRGADAIFSGNGGDNILFHSYSASPIADRILSGRGRGLAGTIRDVCSLTGASLAAVVPAAARHLRRKKYPWQTDRLFLSRAVLDEYAGQDMGHPWLDAPPGALPGKAGHVALLLRIQQHLDGYERADTPPVINPLMSQPVIECCLGIPTWQWIEGGINRAVARRAYRDRLPKEIVDRQSKGGPDAFCLEIIKDRHAEVRARLLDGHLVRQGIVERTSIEQTLSDPRPNLGAAHVRLMALLDTEAWIDHWLDGDGISAARAVTEARSRMASQDLASTAAAFDGGVR